MPLCLGIKIPKHKIGENMIKNITIIQIKKGEKEFDIHIKESSSWEEIFGVAMELRQMALNGINEMIAKETQKTESEKIIEEIKPQ